MTSQTKKMIMACLDADTTATETEKNSVRHALEGKPPSQVVVEKPMNKKQAREFLGVSESTFWRMETAGKISHSFKATEGNGEGGKRYLASRLLEQLTAGNVSLKTKRSQTA